MTERSTGDSERPVRDAVGETKANSMAKYFNDDFQIDTVSEAICKHFNTGKLICLQANIEIELRRRYIEEQSLNPGSDRS